MAKEHGSFVSLNSDFLHSELGHSPGSHMVTCLPPGTTVRIVSACLGPILPRLTAEGADGHTWAGMSCSLWQAATQNSVTADEHLCISSRRSLVLFSQSELAAPLAAASAVSGQTLVLV